jgi:hypothetical protein
VGGIALPRRRWGIVVTGVPNEQGQRLVVVPAHPPGQGDPGDSVRFELRQMTGETPALPVFSTVAGLVRELGPGAWRWDAERVAGLSARAHADGAR